MQTKTSPTTRTVFETLCGVFFVRFPVVGSEIAFRLPKTKRKKENASFTTHLCVRSLRCVRACVYRYPIVATAARISPNQATENLLFFFLRMSNPGDSWKVLPRCVVEALQPRFSFWERFHNESSGTGDCSGLIVSDRPTVISLDLYQSASNTA